ncbi:MAG: helix-turn-helix transcriptional regulator [Clostridiales bacterium]|nr:helix-turn-helix transcriptional regulator [Clostridiales bacterium]
MLDDFASEVRRKRNMSGYTQRQLAEKLHMSIRTILDLENGVSNPKFETVLLIAKELNISIDAILFPELSTSTVSKAVIDFFAGKTETDIQKYILLCQQAEQLKIN